MQRSLRWFLALGAASLAVACGKPDPTDESPWMRPGEDCLRCHTQGGEAEDKIWTAAGTMYDVSGKPLEGAQVLITDATGRSVTLTTNGAGNFYTGEDLKQPFKAAAAGRNGQWNHMASIPQASCNSCHHEGGAAGRTLYAP